MPSQSLPIPLAFCCGPAGPWSKSNAIRGLMVLLAGSFLCSLASVIAAWAGMVGPKAQGQDMCYGFPDTDAQRKALGKWDDMPEGTFLNWYVCERGSDRFTKFSKKNETSGWWSFGRSEYQVFCGWYRQKEASTMCKKMGASLVSINSEVEDKFVGLLCGYESCWIGLSEEPQTETWVWEDGTVLGSVTEWKKYQNWHEGQPNNYATDENVAAMNYWQRLNMPSPNIDAGLCKNTLPRQSPTGTGKWFGVQPEMRIKYTICERKAFVSNGKPHCGEDAWASFGQKCYYRHCGSLTWEEAQSKCAWLGGSVVSIKSSGENQFVRAMCEQNSCRIGLSRHWLGGTDWVWEDGDSIGMRPNWRGFVGWNAGEPTKEDDRESVVVMNGYDLATPYIRAARLRALRPAWDFWAQTMLLIPLGLIVAVIVTGRTDSACLASTIRNVTGIMIAYLVVQIYIFVVLQSHVDSTWVYGSNVLLMILMLLAVLQVGIYCMASQKAQELQWSTTIGFSAMGVRSVEHLNPEPGVSMNTIQAEVNSVVR